MFIFSLQPNAYVFPGGVKSDSDFHPSWNPLLEKYNKNSERYHRLSTTSTTTSNKLNGDIVSSEIGFRLCALRETFEESGILIANDDTGKEVVLSNPDEQIGGKHVTLKEWRKHVYKDPKQFVDLFR